MALMIQNMQMVCTYCSGADASALYYTVLGLLVMVVLGFKAFKLLKMK